VDNQRATATYGKVGFKEEGRSVEAVWIDGAWRDLINMALLRRNWISA
jgi:RimJ/RimL family protein N-acetyltransferase